MTKMTPEQFLTFAGLAVTSDAVRKLTESVDSPLYSTLTEAQVFEAIDDSLFEDMDTEEMDAFLESLSDVDFAAVMEAQLHPDHKKAMKLGYKMGQTNGNPVTGQNRPYAKELKKPENKEPAQRQSETRAAHAHLSNPGVKRGTDKKFNDAEKAAVDSHNKQVDKYVKGANDKRDKDPVKSDRRAHLYVKHMKSRQAKNSEKNNKHDKPNLPK